MIALILIFLHIYMGMMQQGKFEKLSPNVTETGKTGSSLMAAADADMMREKAAVEREKQEELQVQDALTAVEVKKLQLEEKAAKIQRLKSGFRICRPQGTFLWPNMVNNKSSSSINNSSSFLQVQVEVPTPPSVSSSTVPPQLPYCGGGAQPSPPPSIVKPLAEKRAVTVTVSTLSKGQNYEDSGDDVNNSSTANTPALVNLNHAPTNLDDDMPLVSSIIM